MMDPMVCSDSVNGACERVWSEEHDRIPLKQRLKILLASQRISDLEDIKIEEENGSLSIPPIEIVVKKEDGYFDKQGLCIYPPPGFQAKGEYAGEVGRSVSFVREEKVGKPGEPCVRQETEANDSTFQMMIPEINDGDDTLLQDKAKALLTDNNSGHTLGNSINTPSVDGLQAIKVKSEAPDNFLDDLDHIVLKERKRILLSRKPVGLANHVKEGLVNNMVHHTAMTTEGDGNTFLLRKISESGSSNGTTTGPPDFPNTNLKCTKSNLCGGKDFNSQSVLSSYLSTSSNVKVEPLDYNELQNPSNFTGVVPVKSEVAITEECIDSIEDELDHMLLRDRIELMASKEVLDFDAYKKFVFSREIVTSALNCKPVEAKSDTPVRIKRTRKRKKTATDSVETALEEDAPGLLQVLINKGVIVDEIKLYGEKETDEVLDDSLTENSFADLEAVISKLFSQNPSLLKLAPARCTKGEKATYCLACLISLVEQARYLLFRKWPVEWGWCRDLQSFIFVFERHNRIVLERPEYGYATYFFELVDTFPIDWQIKRLVTAMKLTSCSRVTLIENRALKVGEDMSEGEARVLMDYGWVPNSGFGTMLNYRDRVVHDRRNESESSEWRSKIGKLLMDGYNGGRIVPSDIPEKVNEYIVNSSPQIKSEI